MLLEYKEKEQIMISEVSIFLLTIAVSILLSLVVVYYSFKRKEAPGAFYLGLMQLTCLFWNIGYFIEILGNSLPEKMIGVKIQYFFGLPFVSVFWYLSIINFKTGKNRPTTLEFATVSFIPLITVVLALITEKHNLFYINPKLVQVGPFLLIEKDWGWWFYIHVIYSYILNFTGTIHLFDALRKKESVFKKQILLWLSAISLPWIANIAYVLGMDSFMRLDFTNTAFAFSSLIFSYAVFKYGLFDLVPTARDLVIDSMANGLLVLDEKIRIVFANPAAAEMLKNQELIGKELKAVMPEGTNQKLFNEFSIKERSEIELHGSIFEIESRSINVKRSSSRGTILTFYDMTEQKRKEKQLSELNATKDKFFSIIAHDLKNPFFGIMGLTSMLTDSEHELNEVEKEKILNEIKELSSRTYKMLENLLNWSRSQTGTIEFHPEKLSLSELIIESKLQLDGSAEVKKIKILADYGEDISVFADRNMIETVLRNIISNSIKFTPNKGSIRITSKHNNELAVICVEDSGIGMDEEALNELFKIDKTKKSVGTAGEKGTGLGLILCKEFVEKNGGKIWAESILNNGTNIYFSIPLVN